MKEKEPELRPEYWGVWTTATDNEGLFFITGVKRKGRKFNADRFDDLGHALIEGSFRKNGVTFRAKYTAASDVRANKTWMRFSGSKMEYKGDSINPPAVYFGRYSSRLVNGNFFMESLSEESSIILHLFKAIKEGRKILYRG